MQVEILYVDLTNKMPFKRQKYARLVIGGYRGLQGCTGVYRAVQGGRGRHGGMRTAHCCSANDEFFLFLFQGKKKVSRGKGVSVALSRFPDDGKGYRKGNSECCLADKARSILPERGTCSSLICQFKSDYDRFNVQARQKI